MSNYPEILHQLKRRLLVAVPCFLAGGWIMAASPHLFFVGLGIVGVGALVLAWPLAALFAEPTGSLYFPGARFDRPQPMYGIPASKRQRGLYAEAIAEYERLAAEYPDEVKPYQEMIDIALLDLRDPDRALAIFQQGLAALPTQEDKESLARYFSAARQRDLPVAAQEKPILERKAQSLDEGRPQQ
jgi:tetratricopeptide (TPR) repeat protein